jgi:hypothetical protein
LDAVGIGGPATAGSLAAVVIQMCALGERPLDMKELGRETGVTVDWLNAFSHGAPASLFFCRRNAKLAATPQRAMVMSDTPSEAKKNPPERRVERLGVHGG